MTNKPHVHAELIKAWADGAIIQRYNKMLQQWRDCGEDMLDWHPNILFRIKPTPKPNVVRYGCVAYSVWPSYDFGASQNHEDNLKLTFDGETGKLKHAEVINKD